MTLEDILGVAGKTLVMSEGDMRTYVFARKLHPSKEIREMQLSGLREVVIHNAKHVDEVERESIVGRERQGAIKYIPEKSSEPHFYVPETGRLHIVNSRGVIRLKRDEDLAKSLGYFLGRDIELFVNHYEGASSKASHRFEHFAFQLVEDAFQHIDSEAFVRNQRFNVILGPHASLDTSDVVVKHAHESEYLNYRVLKVGNEVALNFDYIFGDQARDILHKVYLVLSSDFRGLEEVNVFHYGKVGILKPGLEIGQIVVPVGSIDEEKILAGKGSIFPLDNELSGNSQNPLAGFFERYVGQKVATGVTVNTISVVGQTIEDLELDRNAGGDVLDMEWAAMAGTSVGSGSTYPWLKRIRYFLAGTGSDKPLEGKNLGNTEYPVQNERLIANAMKEIIRRL